MGATDALVVSWAAGGIQAIVDEAAIELGLPLGIDDPSLGAVAYSAQPDDVDEVRRTSVVTRGTAPEVAAWLFAQGIARLDAPKRIPPNPTLRMRTRICVPLRSGDAMLGYLWLLDGPQPISEEEVARVCERAGEIAAAIEQERLEEDRRGVAEGDLLDALIAGAPATDLGEGLLAMAAAYSVIVFRADEQALGHGVLAESVELMRASVPPHHMLARVGSGEAVVVVASDDPEAEPKARAAAVLDGAARIGAGRLEASRLSSKSCRTVRAGIGAPRRDIHELAAAYREASWAARCADGERQAIEWEELGALRLILPLVGEQPTEAFLPEGVMRLRGARDGEALLATLEAYLDHGGDSRRAAAALDLHRSSLWQRLHRIEEVAEVDLRCGEVRLELHLGLRLWRLSRSGGLAIEP